MATPSAVKIVKIKKPVPRERAEIWLDRLYLAAALLGLPLILHSGYSDITETKTLFFVLVSVVYLLGRGICFIQFRARGERPAPVKTAGEIAAACFCLIALLASLGSGFFRDSLLGPAGRWQGAAMFWLYALLYYAFGARRVEERAVLLPLGAGLFLTSLLAVLNHLGADPLGIIWLLTPFDQDRYISTLGNINFAGAYISLTLPAAMWYLLKTEKPLARLALGAVCLTGFWAAMAVRSESAVLGVGVGMVCLPFLLRGEPSGLRRWGLLLMGTAAAMQLYSLLVRLRGQWLSALTRAALHPAVFALLILTGAAWYILLYLNKGKEKKALTVYGVTLGVGAGLALAALILLNTIWRQADLGAAEAWLHFSDAWGTDRVMVWRHCLAFYKQYIPWDKLMGGGCGVLAAMDEADRLFPDAIVDTAHCEYLQILLNWGALGLTAYLVWLCASVRQAFCSEGALSRALGAGLIAYAVQAAVNIAQAPGITLFFLFLALVRAKPRGEQKIMENRP